MFFQQPALLETICLTLFVHFKNITFISFPTESTNSTKTYILYWGSDPNDLSAVSSLVSVEIFQRHCVWVFWSKILWKQYWYIASKEMYGKTTRAQKDCSYGNLAYIQQMTAALGAFILWWWSQDKSKCLLSFYKGLIIYTLKTVLMSLMCL